MRFKQKTINILELDDEELVLLQSICKDFEHRYECKKEHISDAKLKSLDVADRILNINYIKE